MSSVPSGKGPDSAPGDLSDLQFDRVESFAASLCANCGSAIVDSYYSVQGLTICPACAQAQHLAGVQEPTKHDLIRAAIYGAGAALAGTAVYFAILALSGYEIGWIAVAVGWLVGKAVHKGSRGIGGRKLQILAVVLTYFSIVGSYVPLILKHAIENPPGQKQSDTSAPAAVVERAPVSIPALLIGVAVLFVYCLAMPFLQGFSSIIGLFIICIGLFEAWKLNKRDPITLEGPFPVTGTAGGA